MSPPLHIFPTLACNGDCPFCAIVPGKGEINHKDGRYLPPERWGWMLAKRSPSALYITGGEPMLYRGIEVVVNSVKCPVWLYTNGSVNLVPFLLRLRDIRRLHVRLSFHPGIGFKTALRAANVLREAGVQFGLHIVGTSIMSKAWVGRFKTFDHDLVIDPDFQQIQKWNGGSRVMCNVPNISVGPDGKVHPCTSKLVRGVGGLFGIDEDKPVTTTAVYKCDEPDACCPCDLAFLKRIAA